MIVYAYNTTLHLANSVYYVHRDFRVVKTVVWRTLISVNFGASPDNTDTKPSKEAISFRQDAVTP